MHVTSLLILNGPGLVDLERLESGFDRNLTRAHIESECEKLCLKHGIAMTFRQGDIVPDLLEWAANDASYDALIINPIGYNAREADDKFEQYCSAIKAIARLRKPIVEVHLANIFHHGAELSEPLHEPGAQIGFISGLGPHAYLLAIDSIAQRFRPQGQAA